MWCRESARSYRSISPSNGDMQQAATNLAPADATPIISNPGDRPKASIARDEGRGRPNAAAMLRPLGAARQAATAWPRQASLACATPLCRSMPGRSGDLGRRQRPRAPADPTRFSRHRTVPCPLTRKKAWLHSQCRCCAPRPRHRAGAAPANFTVLLLVSSLERALKASLAFCATASVRARLRAAPNSSSSSPRLRPPALAQAARPRHGARAH